MVGDTTEGYRNIDREIFNLSRATPPLAFFPARGSRLDPIQVCCHKVHLFACKGFDCLYHFKQANGHVFGDRGEGFFVVDAVFLVISSCN